MTVAGHLKGGAGPAGAGSFGARHPAGTLSLPGASYRAA
jgi:hypothetical protein